MRFGIQLPIQAQSTMFVQDWERKAGPDDLVAIAQACDRSGFDYVAVCDHLGIPDRLEPAMSAVWFDPIATLSMLAGVTSRTRLLTHVYVAAFRHPLAATKSLSTLDWLSNGRLVIGVGTGHVAEEFESLGLDFHKRGALLDAAVEAVDAALVSGTHDGLHIAPRPVQEPRPPIWVGGSSPAALRRAARYEGWLPQGTPKDEMPASIAVIKAERSRLGRENEPFEMGFITGWLDPLGRPVDQIAESLDTMSAVGVTNLQVRFKSESVAQQVEQIEAFGTGVGPLLGGR